MSESTSEQINELWQEAWKVCVGDKDLSNARVSGRATKATPNKEDATQWQKQGVVFVQDYVKWRKANPEKAKLNILAATERLRAWRAADPQQLLHTPSQPPCPLSTS